jgi:hypothetical protein
METIRIKNAIAGIWGGGSWLGSWWLSAECGVILARLIQLGGLISVILSIVYIFKINRHKDYRQSLEDARIERKLCKDCVAGKYETGSPCPLPDEHRPLTCPLMVKAKVLAKVKKSLDDITKEETTKK